MKISFEQYIMEERTLLSAFEVKYMALHKEDPERYPLEIDESNLSLWQDIIDNLEAPIREKKGAELYSGLVSKLNRRRVTNALKSKFNDRLSWIASILKNGASEEYSISMMQKVFQLSGHAISKSKVKRFLSKKAKSEEGIEELSEDMFDLFLGNLEQHTRTNFMIKHSVTIMVKVSAPDTLVNAANIFGQVYKSQASASFIPCDRKGYEDWYEWPSKLSVKDNRFRTSTRLLTKLPGILKVAECFEDGPVNRVGTYELALGK